MFKSMVKTDWSKRPVDSLQWLGDEQNYIKKKNLGSKGEMGSDGGTGKETAGHRQAAKKKQQSPATRRDFPANQTDWRKLLPPSWVGGSSPHSLFVSPVSISDSAEYGN